MINYKHLLFLLLLSASCNKHFVATQYNYEQQKVSNTTATAESVNRILIPFKDSLDKIMNVEIGYAAESLTKKQPESDLGNLMCEIILSESQLLSKEPIDFAVVNYGGIRLPGLPVGPITLGKITELMPFENRIVLMKLNGETLDSLFNLMATKGGWPVSGARYKMTKDKAVDITIQNQALQPDRIYTVAISDYLAQGGDNCVMLSDKPMIDLKVRMRDMLIDGIKKMTAKGERIRSILDGRVSKIN